MNLNQERFEAWLFSQPRDRAYNYMDNDNCLLCMFIKETTNAREIRAGGSYIRVGESRQPIPRWLNDEHTSVLTPEFFGFNFTFGQAQDAYRKLHPNFTPLMGDNPFATQGKKELTIGYSYQKAKTNTVKQ